MAIVTLIQELSPERARAAWTVVSLGAAMAVLVAAPLFIIFLSRRARLRENNPTKKPTRSPIDPWVEAGRRMTDRMDPQDDASTGDESGDAGSDASGNWESGP